MANKDFEYIGIDDGFAETDLVNEKGQSFVIKSSARSGKNQAISVGIGEDSGAQEIGEYRTEDGVIYTVGIEDGESTHSNAYPLSDLNRVIVHHAMHRAGLSGKKVKICTGLPVNMFYSGYTKNERFTEKKVNNLKGRTVLPVNGDESIEVIEHIIIPECVAGWFDYLIDDNGKKRDGVDMNAPIAVVDIGGNTTDVAAIVRKEVDLSRSGSIKCGVIHARNDIKKEILDAFDLDELSFSNLDMALSEGKIRIFGKTQDVSEIVTEVKLAIIGRIHRDIELKLGKASEFEKVIFIGGGSIVFDRHISNWFRNFHRVTKPSIANARGMRKYIQYVAQA